MSKFHIKRDGIPGVCHATKNCPLGGEDSHYNTVEEAQTAAQEKLEKSHGLWDNKVKAVSVNEMSDNDLKTYITYNVFNPMDNSFNRANSLLNEMDRDDKEQIAKDNIPANYIATIGLPSQRRRDYMNSLPVTIDKIKPDLTLTEDTSEANRAYIENEIIVEQTQAKVRIKAAMRELFELDKGSYSEGEAAAADFLSEEITTSTKGLSGRNLQKLNAILDDPRSPAYSAFQDNANAGVLYLECVGLGNGMDVNSYLNPISQKGLEFFIDGYPEN